MLKLRRLALVGLTAGLVTLAAPASALAATTRYAAPTTRGSGNCSTADNACDLTTAVNSASSGDDVLALPGTYSLSGSLNPPAGVSLTGQAGSRPVINVTGSGFLGTYTDNGTVQSTVSNLEVESTGTTAAYPIGAASGATLTHLVVGFSSSSGSVEAVDLGAPSTLSDSVVRASGSQMSGVVVTGSFSPSTPATLTNDSVYATGTGSLGVNVQSTCFPVPDTAAATLENVIAHGDGDGLATSAFNPLPCGTAPASQLSVSYSNYNGAAQNNGNLTDKGHNQTTPAQTSPATLFVLAPTNLHERTGAPTIDAGSSAGIEATDLDNLPRTQGSAPDIGAYETSRPAPPPSVHCVVPKLKGKKIGKARKLLSAAHCALGKVKKLKHHKGKLIVKSQSASPGTNLADGASVSVKLGPKPHHKHHH